MQRSATFTTIVRKPATYLRPEIETTKTHVSPSSKERHGRIVIRRTRIIKQLHTRRPQTLAARPQHLRILLIIQILKERRIAALVRDSDRQLFQLQQFRGSDGSAEGMQAVIHGIVFGDAPLEDAVVGGCEG